MPGKMAYLGYTANDATVYSVKTRARYLTALNQTAGGVVALGFLAYAPGRPSLPRGMRMRGIYVRDPSGGATRLIPVGATDAPAWDGSIDTVQVDYSGIGTFTDARIEGKREERPAQVPHEIYNVSDAS